MKNTGGQHGVGTTKGNALNQVVQVTRTAGCDHRNFHGVGNGAGYSQLEYVFGAVTVHTGQQDFTGTQIGHAHRPGHCIDTGGLTSTMGEYLPARLAIHIVHALGVNRHDNTLRTETLGGLTHQFGVVNSRSIDTDLVGPGIEHGANIVHRANTTAHR